MNFKARCRNKSPGLELRQVETRLYSEHILKYILVVEPTKAEVLFSSHKKTCCSWPEPVPAGQLKQPECFGAC